MSTDERQTAVSDLRLSVFLRPVHPEFFTIRARRTLHQGAFDAEVWLLEPGHVITFLSGEHAVTEVLAPRELALPTRARAHTADVSGSGEQCLEFRGVVTYTAAYQADAETAEHYRTEAEELLAGARQSHLFAEAAEDLARRRFSYAVPELRARSLLVHAWHGFPAENTILKTQTLIERTD